MTHGCWWLPIHIPQCVEDPAVFFSEQIVFSQDVLSPKIMNSWFLPPFSILIYNLQMMVFRTRILLGRMGMYDQYQDWRLDVDNLTYEVPSHWISCITESLHGHLRSHYFAWQELLDLEDRIGYVSTGLREDEITRSLRMVKYSAFNPKHFSTEMDRRCSICQVCPFSFALAPHVLHFALPPDA